MSGKLTRAAYEELIAEDIAWLENIFPRTLERDHIIQVLKASPDHEYGPRKHDSSPTATAPLELEITPENFAMPELLRHLLRGDIAPNWRTSAVIIPRYMPPHSDALTKPTCVVRFGKWFLRYSHGPRQGHFWDLYGDDYLSPELALIALLQADPP